MKPGNGWSIGMRETFRQVASRNNERSVDDNVWADAFWTIDSRVAQANQFNLAASPTDVTDGLKYVLRGDE